MNYRVRIDRTVTYHRFIEIEAPTAQQAEDYAIDTGRSTSGWIQDRDEVCANADVLTVKERDAKDK